MNESENTNDETTVKEVVDIYMALRDEYFVTKAAAETMDRCSVTPSLLVDAFNAKILDLSRPSEEADAIHGYRNELLSHFTSSNQAEAPMVIRLKRIAQKGGERGPHYDQSVLSVVESIEEKGNYEPVPAMRLLHGYALNVESGVFTAEELDEAKKLAVDLGLSIEQGEEFAGGVRYAEEFLKAHVRTQES
ncbi:hypothetical protein Q31b_33880 [Novipirellula aureliae]|uniref:Uncharacterized protein n=1 Tax=Novipirellula aureliae TaxID=2527966 RepID=A0A5C6DUU9_9BACT|nr:hypothetical protein [Novipirellula aureliae]TWU40044.1 hypothetical protein Q31b_33880 [Novipirellula aureliae]